MRIPIANWRSVLAPTNDPTFGEMPCDSIARSHASKPCGPMNRRDVAAAAAGASASESSLIGAPVYASPKISVVMPCVTLLTSRPSPET